MKSSCTYCTYESTPVRGWYQSVKPVHRWPASLDALSIDFLYYEARLQGPSSASSLFFPPSEHKRYFCMLHARPSVVEYDLFIAVMS